uniref:Uncharacterized protein n=1 Tax=Setaria italica TaxID=4555 RepID=K3YF72_SETIT
MVSFSSLCTSYPYAPFCIILHLAISNKNCKKGGCLVHMSNNVII